MWKAAARNQFTRRVPAPVSAGAGGLGRLRLGSTLAHLLTSSIGLKVEEDESVEWKLTMRDTAESYLHSTVGSIIPRRALPVLLLVVPLTWGSELIRS